MKHSKIILLLACIFCCVLQARAQETISLAGDWTVRLDEQKKGEQQQWYKQGFDTKIHLPGTLDDAGIGQPPAPATGLTKETMMHLARKHAYIGYAWYARQVEIPASWKEKSIGLC